MSGAFPLLAAHPRGGQPGPVALISRARVVWAWGPSTGFTACLLASWCCALGGCFAPLRGASEVRRSSFPGCPSLGRVVGVRRPHAAGAGVRAWGSDTVPLAHLPCGRLRVAWVVGRRPGGGGNLSLLWGESGVRRFPSPGRPS